MKRQLWSVFALCAVAGSAQAALDPSVPSWKAVLEGKLEGSMMVSVEGANPYNLEVRELELVTLKSLGEVFSKTPYGVHGTALYEPSFFTVLCALPQSRLGTEAVIFNTLRAAGYQPGPSRSLESVRQILWLSMAGDAPHLASQIEYKCGPDGGYAQVALYQVGTPEQLAFSQKRYRDLLEGSKGAEEVVGVKGVTSLKGVRLVSEEVQTINKEGTVALRLKNTTNGDIKATLRITLLDDKGKEIKTLKRGAIVIAQGTLDRPIGFGDPRATKIQVRILDVQPSQGEDGGTFEE